MKVKIDILHDQSQRALRDWSFVVSFPYNDACSSTVSAAKGLKARNQQRGATPCETVPAQTKALKGRNPIATVATIEKVDCAPLGLAGRCVSIRSAMPYTVEYWAFSPLKSTFDPQSNQTNHNNHSKITVQTNAKAATVETRCFASTQKQYAMTAAIVKTRSITSLQRQLTMSSFRSRFIGKNLISTLFHEQNNLSSAGKQLPTKPYYLILPELNKVISQRRYK